MSESADALGMWFSDGAVGGRAGVLVTRRHPTYKDEPGRLYHYPRATYERAVLDLRGCLVLAYEPRRGGVSAEAVHGGRSAFIGCAVLGESSADPSDASHAYVELRHYSEFAFPVPISKTPISGKALQTAVLRIDPSHVEPILRLGFAGRGGVRSWRERPGLVDASDLELAIDRPMREVITSRAVRDAAFRFRVVEQVYAGRCAFTGLSLTNGNGRAEADAAHIRPVASGGPDSVRNGIALSKTVHWAFDRGLVSMSDDGRILVVERGIDEGFRRALVPSGTAILPEDIEDRPHTSFLRWHRENTYKGVA